MNTRHLKFIHRHKPEFAFPAIRILILVSAIESGLTNVHSPTTNRNQDQTPAAIPVELASLYFEQAKQLAAGDHGELWGLSLHGPMIFVDSATRFAIANEADREKLLRPIGVYRCGYLPADVQIANTSLEWAGVRWTTTIPNGERRFLRNRKWRQDSIAPPA